MRVRRTIPLIAVALVCAAPSSAAAATRYASPGGTGPAATCPQSDPCSIADAVGGTAGGGDTVVALPGTYSLGASLSPSPGVTLIGEPGKPRPRLLFSGPAGLNLGAGTAGRNLYVEGTDAGGDRVVDVVGAGVLLEQSEVVGNGDAPFTLQVRDGGVLRSSIVRSNSTAPFGGAIVVGGSGGAIENVTAIGAGTAPARGIAIPASYGLPSLPSAVSIVNTIADGNGGPAIEASDDGGPDEIVVTVEHSNFPELSEQPPDARIALGSSNQTAPSWPAPLLASPASADFHQLPGSATINAGRAGAGGALDVDGERRAIESAVDIGADEFPGACAGSTATVSGTDASETLVGTPGSDVFAALGGNDTIKGRGGDDVACGGKGKDRLLGGAGNDRLLGEDGRDTLKGGAGKDRLLGGPGRDRLLGGKGKDRLNGGPGRDRQIQ